jgi:hypothetical protein
MKFINTHWASHVLEGAGSAASTVPPAAAPPAAAPPAAAPPAAVPLPVSASWLDRLPPEDKAWAESKGWKGDAKVDELFPTVLQSYRNVEQLMGADKAGRTLLMPKDANDKEALASIYEKLGKPKEATGYELDLPADANKDFVHTAKSWFHNSNLTADQAKAVTSAYAAYELTQKQALEEQHATQVDTLKGEWGVKFDTNIETGRAALKAAGFTQDEIKALEIAVGPYSAAKKFEFFGRNYVEAGPPGNEQRSKPGFNDVTPAAAKQKMTQLRADPNFMARYGHKDPKIRLDAMNEMDKLAEIATRGNM